MFFTVFLSKTVPFLAVCLSFKDGEDEKVDTAKSMKAGNKNDVSTRPFGNWHLQYTKKNAEKPSPGGSIQVEMWLLPKEFAERLPAGEGREEPVRQRSSLFTAFPCVSLPFLAVPLRLQRTVAIRTPTRSSQSPTGSR
eukprot:SAG22_NODE_3671_length_1584_cov_1.618855_3_plen_138_part_00